MPSPGSETDERRLRHLAHKVKVLTEKRLREGYEPTDLGAATVDALRRHTTSPEFLERYKRWLLASDYASLTPTAKANLDALLAEERAGASSRPDRTQDK